jgi:calcium/calmodulin dependent protein kinase II association protein
MSDVRDFIERHLQAIFDGDVATYKATTAEDLGLYEWYVVPQRIDGIPFHEFLMTEAARLNAAPMTGEVLTAGERPAERPRVHFDLANYREQLYGDTAIVSYTLLISTSAGAGVSVRSYNESRVMVKLPEGWRVVHVHKSPSWNAPFQPPAP